MPEAALAKRKRALKKAVIYGALTLAFYLGVFLNQPLVMTYFTKGGLYAILPVSTAFLISFAHGAFTGNFWSALGVEASRKATRAELPAVRRVQRVRPRPRLTLNT